MKYEMWCDQNVLDFFVDVFDLNVLEHLYPNVFNLRSLSRSENENMF